MTSLGHPTFDSRQCQINARQPEKEEVHDITLVFQSTNQSQVAFCCESVGRASSLRCDLTASHSIISEPFVKDSMASPIARKRSQMPSKMLEFFNRAEVPIRVRASIAEELGERQYLPAREALLAGLSDSDANMRSACIRAVGTDMEL